MHWREVDDATVKRLFVIRGLKYREIAEMYEGATRNSVAGRCQRLGLVRKDGVRAKRERLKRQNNAPASEERVYDQRDIDILCDVAEGHAPADVAAHWKLPVEHVENLIAEARG